MGITYKDAGVDIDAGAALVDRIRDVVRSTDRPETLSGVGGFAALTRLDLARFPRPVLVTGTDGVGTKLRVAREMGVHNTIGIDLVAMCANDALTTGAEPLVFLDYFATGALDVEIGAQVVTGIAEGCRQAGAALVGGETAEMPSMYAPGDYDLAGFIVGVVNEDARVDGARVSPGDVILGLGSDGVHSNGLSLARKICFEAMALKVSDTPEGLDRSIGSELLRPTRIYVRSILPVAQSGRIKAMAHITGGGLPENTLRMFPEGMGARIDRKAWDVPAIFDILRAGGDVSEAEMYRTFNMGIGFVVVVDPTDQSAVADELAHAGERVWEIGRVTDTGRFEWSQDTRTDAGTGA